MYGFALLSAMYDSVLCNMTPKEAIRNIISSTCRIDGAYYYAARKSGIGENELNLLYMLDDGNEHPQHQLSAELMIPKTTISTVVKGLVEKGLIKLRANGKENMLSLTEKGKEETAILLSPIYQAEERAMERVLEKYDEDFVEAFSYLSDALCDEIGKIGHN